MIIATTPIMYPNIFPFVATACNPSVSCVPLTPVFWGPASQAPVKRWRDRALSAWMEHHRPHGLCKHWSLRVWGCSEPCVVPSSCEGQGAPQFPPPASRLVPSDPWVESPTSQGPPRVLRKDYAQDSGRNSFPVNIHVLILTILGCPLGTRIFVLILNDQDDSPSARGRSCLLQPAPTLFQ